MAARTWAKEFQRAAALLEADLPLAAMERLAACGATARAREDAPALLWVAIATAHAYASLEQPGRGLQALTEAEVASAGASPALRLAAREALARFHLAVHRPQQALAIAVAALAEGEALAGERTRSGGELPRIPSPARSLACLWVHRAAAEAAREKWAEAASAAAQAAAAMRRLKDDAGWAEALYWMGRSDAAMGRTDDAERHLTAALRRDEAAHRSRAEARDHSALAALAEDLGQSEPAMAHGSAALGLLWSRVGRLDRWDVARLCHLFGTILAGTGDRQLAIQCLSRAAAYYGQSGDHEAALAASVALDGLLRETSGEGGPTPSLPDDLRARVRALTTMLGLLDDLASTDPHLERHATVVTGYALRLASAMRIPADRMSALVHACRLYHLGQSAAGEGPAHPVLGAELLRAFPLPEQTLTAVRHFRERWDGGGYPQGLAGAEIPQLARLLALVDGYVSLALDPAEPLPHSGALALVRARAGTAYDPAVVDAFSRLHEAAATE